MLSDGMSTTCGLRDVLVVPTLRPAGLPSVAQMPYLAESAWHRHSLLHHFYLLDQKIRDSSEMLRIKPA